MKFLKYFLGTMLFVGMLGFVSCDGEETPDEPDFTADYPEAAKVDGKITIFAKFETTPCEDVVCAGSYLLKAGSSDWDIDNVSQLKKFTPARKVGDKDWGAEGWWEVTLDIPATAAIPEHNAIIGIKPVQLEGGEFDWSYQVGYPGHDASTIEVKSGDVEVAAGYDNECNIYIATNATAAIVFKAWKNDPCKVVKRNYTFNVTVPAGTPDNADIYLVGDMNKWTVDATKLNKVSAGKYSITLNNVREGAAYKYVMNATWANEELAETGPEGCAEAIGNRATGSSAAINDDVKNWRRITIDKCGDGTYPDEDAVDGKITIFAKFETELCGEVGLVGTNNGWGDNPPRFERAGVIDGKDWGAAGWWKITVDLSSETAFNWGEKGSGVVSGKPIQFTPDGKFSWDYQIGYYDESDIEVLAGGVEVWKGDGGECDLLFRTNTTAVFIFHKWKNDPCNASPAIPGGTGTFTVTITSEVEEGANIIFTGNFADKEWGNSDRVMTFADGKYTWTGTYPENFECKVFKRIAGVDTWASGGNQKFDGKNYSFEFSF